MGKSRAWLILGTSVLAGVKGLYDIVNSNLKVQNAQKAYEERKQQYDVAENEYINKRDYVQGNLNDLVKVRWQASVTLGKAAEFLKNARVKEREFQEKIDVTSQQLEHWQGISFEALRILEGISKSFVAGTTTATASYILVGNLATASTGTAISTLSGAAATNATLAWLGGGSLASGGGGIALGTTVLQGVTVGPALLVSGIFANHEAEKIKTVITEKLAEIDIAEKEMQVQMVKFDAINQRTKELKESTRQMDDALRNILSKADPDVIEDAYQVATTAKSLANIIDIPVIDKEGNFVG